MKEVVVVEGGVKARKLGGGQMCSMDMFGMDTLFRMYSGSRIIPQRCQ